MYPHECASLSRLWENEAVDFGIRLASALNNTFGKWWAEEWTHYPRRNRGWPGDSFILPAHDARAVAVHLRCGDVIALGSHKKSYAFVPFSLYRRVLRAGDHVVLVTASMR